MAGFEESYLSLIDKSDPKEGSEQADEIKARISSKLAKMAEGGE